MYTPMDGETKQNKTVSKMTGNLFCSNVRKKHRNSSSFFSPFLVNPQQSENFEDFNFWKKRISPLFFYNSENMPHTRALGQQMARGVSPIRDDAFVLVDVHHLFFFFGPCCCAAQLATYWKKTDEHSTRLLSGRSSFLLPPPFPLFLLAAAAVQTV